MYNNAKRALRIFWDAGKSKLPFESFEAMIDYYRTDFDVTDVLGNPIKHDDFLRFFEQSLNYSSPSDTQAAMKSLAASLPKGKIPNTSSFFDALSNQVEKFTFEDAKEVLAKTVEQAKEVATVAAVGGVGLFLLKMVAAFVIVEWLSRGK